MENPEHIPSRFFDLMGEKAFQQLTAEEQEECKKYFSADEFDALHNAMLLAHSAKEDPEVAPEIKTNLLLAFDKKYDAVSHTKTPIMLYPVHLWKVAAIFLLLAGGIFWTLLHTKMHREISYITIKDTVYIPSFSDKGASPRVYDTVYINPDEQNNTGQAAHNGNSMETVIHEPVGTFTYVASSVAGVRLLSVRGNGRSREQEKEKRKPDDTLLQHGRGIGL